VIAAKIKTAAMVATVRLTSANMRKATIYFRAAIGVITG
jgi:hypothetical protein